MELNFSAILVSTLLFSCPLVILATAGILNTRAGIANLSLDGMMATGAGLYCLIVSQLKGSLGTGVIILAFFVAILMGFLFSLIYSFATITCRADQLLVSMAINFLGYGLAVALPIAFIGSLNFSTATIYINLNPVLAIILTLVVVYIFAIILLLTKFGLYIRALGENPTVAALSYIHVRRSRYIISAFSCSLTCLAGAILVYVQPTLFIAYNNFNGLGFLVIALFMIARSKFVRVTIICLVFAFLYQLMIAGQTVSKINEVVPNWLLGMSPYLITLIFLMIFRLDTSLPQSWGLPYIKTGQIKQ